MTRARTPILVVAAFSVLAVLATGAAESTANPALIKSNIVVVKPRYHPSTSRAFAEWSIKLARLADDVERKDPRLKQYSNVLRTLARHYRGLSTSPGHGTGWLWMPKGGASAYVVTNRHVAGQAGSATIEFANGRHPAVENNAVVYVDARHDIAVIEVPRNRLPREASGFDLIETTMTEGNPVFAAGFPGTDTARGRIPAYSLTNGIVSNAEFPGPEGLAIAHTATIDPGNSGGPLLVEVPTATLGFRVSGMNTWKATTRTNVNIAVPVPVIVAALRRAQEAQRTAADKTRLARDLRRTAERLADELGSSRPDFNLLRGMIAYSFVAERPEIVSVLIQRLVSGQMKEAEFSRFVQEPVEYSRETLWALFFSAFSTGTSSVGDVRLESITDEGRIALDRKIRSVYRIAGKRQEIVWVWEHGAWRIADASFEQVWKKTTSASDPAAKTTVAAGVPRSAETRAAAPGESGPGDNDDPSLGFRIGLGGASISGDFIGTVSGIDSTSLSADVVRPISRHLSLVTGLGYSPLGVEYDVSTSDGFVNIEERVGYLQVPALVQLNLPVVGEVGTLNLVGRAGLALDVAVSRGGTFSTAFDSGSLSDPALDWYNEHNFLNVAAILGAGIELGIGREPTLLLGFDVTTERHLLDEWTDEQFGGANYKYNATRFGLSLRYRGWR